MKEITFLFISHASLTNYSSNTKKLNKNKIAVDSLGLSGGHPTPSTLLSITWRVLGLSVKMLFTDFSSAFNTIIPDILLAKLTNLVHVHWSKTFILTDHMSLQSQCNYKRLPPILTTTSLTFCPLEKSSDPTGAKPTDSRTASTWAVRTLYTN